MRRRGVSLGLAVLLFALSAPLAAQDVLQAVPGDALAVMVIPKLDALDAKVQAFAQHIRLPAPSPLGSLKALAGLHKGLDEKGSGALVAMSLGGGGRPSGVVLLPVSNYDEFAAQLTPEKVTDAISKVRIGGNDVLLAKSKSGNFAALASADDQAALESLLSAKESLAASVKSMADWPARQDGLLIFTRQGLATVIPAAKEGLAKAKEAFPADLPQGDQVRAALGMYQQLLDLLDKEVQQVGLGLRIDDKQNLYLAARVQLTPGGEVAKALAAAGPLKQPPSLAGLPAGPYVVAVAAGSLGSGAKFYGGTWWSEMMKANPAFAGLSDEQLKSIVDASTKSMASLRSMSFWMGVPQGDEPLYARLVALTKVDDAAAYLELSQKTMADLRKALGDKPVPGMKFDVKPMKFEGYPGLELTTDLREMLQAQGAPQALPLLEKMFGSADKLTAYVLAADKQTVVTGYVKPAAVLQVAAALKAHEAGLADDAGIKQTAALLPSGAAVAVYTSPQGWVEFVRGILGAVAPQAPVNLPAFPETPPAGGSILGVTDGLQFDWVVPAETSLGIRDYVDAVQQAN